MNRQQRRKLEKQNKKSRRSPVVQNSATASPPQERIEEGVQLYNAQQYPNAETIFRELTSSFPTHAHSYFLLGAVLEAQGNKFEAKAAYEKAVTLNPANGDYHNHLALLYDSSGDPDRAISAFQKTIQVNPQNFMAYYNLGNTLSRQGNIEDAIKCFQSACALNPKQLEAHLNLANSLQAVNRIDEAIASFKNVLGLNPSYAAAHHGLGTCLRYLDQMGDSIIHCRQAITLAPENASYRYGLTFPLLASGEVREGLDAYEYRFQNSVVPRIFSQPLWDGASDISEQTILIWGEQGTGDVVIWASAVSEVISKARHCIIECHPKLVELLDRSFPRAEVIPEDPARDAIRTDIDTHVPIASLFHRLRPDLSAGLSPAAFITADRNRIDFWENRLRELGPGTKVGISWSSPHMTPKRAPNYTDLAEWAPILETPGMTFINLQCMNYEDDLKTAQKSLGVTIHDFEYLDLFHDIEGIAGLTTTLDLVISVATGVAPIAAALGTKVWQLTWRQSPWSNFLLSPRGPDVTYFYRDTLDSWDDVIAEVAGQLAILK